MSPCTRYLSAVLIATTLGCGTAGAAPTTVYRCDTEGRAYSQMSCEGGRILTVEDRPSVAARREAQAVAERDARLAREMAAERIAREQAAAKLGAAGIHHPVRQLREPAVGQVHAADRSVRKDRSDKAGDRSRQHARKDRDSRVTHVVKFPAPRKERAPKGQAKAAVKAKASRA